MATFFRTPVNCSLHVSISQYLMLRDESYIKYQLRSKEVHAMTRRGFLCNRFFELRRTALSSSFHILSLCNTDQIVVSVMYDMIIV